MTYQLWDSSTGNCIGAYPSEWAALDTVATLASRYGNGAREVATLGLVAETDDGEHSTLVAAGDALIELALTTLTQPA